MKGKKDIQLKLGVIAHIHGGTSCKAQTHNSSCPRGTTLVKCVSTRSLTLPNKPPIPKGMEWTCFHQHP